MKLQLEAKEIIAMKEMALPIMAEFEGFDLETFNKYLAEKQDLGAIKMGPKMTKKGVIFEIEWNVDFVAGLYDIYGKYIPLLISQGKSIAQTIEMMFDEEYAHAEKYIKLPDQEE